MSTQYILLPLQEFHADQELAFVQSPDGRSVMRQGLAPLVLLDKVPNTVLIVPAQRLSFHLINLPKAPAAKLKIALEGILEDLLLDEPSSLALALAPHAQEKNATWVAVFEKAWMTSLLEAFDLAGHKITRIIPQAFPSLEPHLEVQGTEESPWLIRSDKNGVLSSPLQLAAQMGADLSTDQIIYCPAHLATAVESYLGRQATIRSLGQAILNSANTEWDLAQFDIRVGGSNPLIRKLKKAFDSFRLDSHWRFARWGVFLLLLSQLVGLNFVAWQEKKRLEAKKQESTVLLQKTFPEVKVVVNPNLQMNRQLDLLRQTSSQLASSDMETLLSITGSILPDQILPSAYQYQDKQLLISGLPTETFVIQAMQSQAQQRGYEIAQQGAQYALRVAKPKTSSSTVAQDANPLSAASKNVGVTPEGQP